MNATLPAADAVGFRWDTTGHPDATRQFEDLMAPFLGGALLTISAYRPLGTGTTITLIFASAFLAEFVREDKGGALRLLTEKSQGRAHSATWLHLAGPFEALFEKQRFTILDDRGRTRLIAEAA